MSKSYNTRSIALSILSDVLIKNRSRDESLKRHIEKERQLSERDRAFVFNIVINTLRYKEVFDEIIERIIKKPANYIDKEILLAIDTALTQILILDNVPTYAAVFETIEGFKYLEGDKTKSIGFLNYALRRISQYDSIKELFTRYQSHNRLLAKLKNHLKDELIEREILEIYKTSFMRPKLAIRINNKVISPEDVLKRLHSNGISSGYSEIVENAVIIETDIPLSRLNEILPSEGFTIQSELSQLAAFLLSLNDGDSLLDVCSGNQIKAGQIRDIYGDRIDITSIDIKKNTAQIGRFIKADARNIRLDEQFDRVLLDAPCSGLGTLAYNPEIKFKINRESIIRHSNLQYQILSNISRYTKPGGRLLYSVCTITRSETEKNIIKFLEENRDFEIIMPDMNSSILRQYLTQEGFLRIFNYNNNSFFYALMERR